MTEPEVSLKIAMHFIQSGETLENVSVSIDGSHIKINDTIHFDIVEFLRRNGYVKCVRDGRWQGEYKNERYISSIIVSSRPGVGDVNISLCIRIYPAVLVISPLTFMGEGKPTP